MQIKYIKQKVQIDFNALKGRLARKSLAPPVAGFEPYVLFNKIQNVREYFAPKMLFHYSFSVNRPL